MQVDEDNQQQVCLSALTTHTPAGRENTNERGRSKNRKHTSENTPYYKTGTDVISHRPFKLIKLLFIVSWASPNNELYQ